MLRAREIFERLREDLAPAEITSLRIEVREHFDRLVLAQQRNELVAVDLAQLLCDRIEELLTMAHLLQAEPRSLIVGAARYFISAADAVPDDKSCTGLDDDVEIFNHVVRTIGRADLVISE